MIISFGGTPGSGKSIIAERLAKKLGWKHYYIGALRRQAAEKRGLTLAEYNKLGETDRATDQEVDNYQKTLGETEDNFIIEGRTSWYFIPQSLKIFLDVSPAEGARRIFIGLQKGNRNGSEDKELDSEAAVEASNQRRTASDDLRYRQYYGINFLDHNNYDLYLDTTGMAPDEVFAKVEEFVSARLDRTKN